MSKPEAHTQSSRIKSMGAFTRKELLVTIACVMLLLALLLASLPRVGPSHPVVYCFNNLKQIGLAFQMYAEDNNNHYPMHASVTNGGTMEFIATGLVFPHFRVMSNELSTPKTLICPEDKHRTYATNFASELE